MTRDPRRRAGLVLLVLAAVAALLALWALLTGGFRVHLFGIPVSVRDEHRAALVGAILAVAGFVLIDRGLRMSAAAIRALRSGASSTATWVESRAPVLLTTLALAAAVAVLYLGVQLGVRSAGGSDPSGYVSEAMLWRAGNLRLSNALAANAPWPNADGTFTPLAYRPSAGHTLVPVVAPGLPLLMALALTVVGPCGPFLVGPLCAAMIVLATYALGVRVAGPAVGAMAALAVAASPTMLFMSMSAMSDVPAAAFWTASLAFACRRGTLMSLASALAAGTAIMIRPNLAPLALGPMFLVFGSRSPRDGPRRCGAQRCSSLAACRRSSSSHGYSTGCTARHSNRDMATPPGSSRAITSVRTSSATRGGSGKRRDQCPSCSCSHRGSSGVGVRRAERSCGCYSASSTRRSPATCSTSRSTRGGSSGSFCPRSHLCSCWRSRWPGGRRRGSGRPCAGAQPRP